MFKIFTGTALALLLSGPTYTTQATTTPIALEYKSPAQMKEFTRTEQCFIWLLKEESQTPATHTLPHKQ